MTTIDEQALRRLDQLLQQQLPGAAIKIQTLPRTPGLQLALLDPEFDDRDLSQAIKNKLMDDPPYWIFCWASGYGLAELLLNRHYSVQDKIVVDFGAGSGVVAIAAKLAGAKKVYACEIDPIGCEVTSLNAAINQVEVEVIRDLSQAKGCELLLAADVLYELIIIFWICFCKWLKTFWWRTQD